MTDFETLRKTWTELGAIDPLWAILTCADKEHGRWDLAEFLLTGERAVEVVLTRIKALAVPLRAGRALDFGCGVGRISRALSKHFSEVRGVDVAESMVAHARRLHSDRPQCVFHVNPRDDLSIFPDAHFDLVFSYIVLQHIPPEFSRRYVREFVRVLAPGGVAAFQLTAEIRQHGDQFRAEIELLEALEWVPGATVTLRCRVLNASTVQWVSAPGHEFNLGNHWYDHSGTKIFNDDGRVRLPDLVAGEAVEVRLTVNAPRDGGRYVLGLDVVQEHVSWFADAGSEEVRIPIVVSTGADRGATGERKPPPWAGVSLAPLPSGDVADPAAADKPAFEMHGVPRAEVLAILEGAGAKVLAVDGDGSAEPNWESWFYYVSR